MASSLVSTLTPLQVETLHAFFEREAAFFLTGGAALAGFYLAHRATDDLDLFTVDDEAFRRGRSILADVATAVGGTVEIRQDTPRFVRSVITRNDTAVIVDLVRDQIAQVHPIKPVIDGIRVDPPDEILVNKLAAMVGRAEERDLVDVMCLEKSGLRVEDALPAALMKDGGCTPATLAWLLSEIVIPDGIVLPAATSAAELREYVASLIVRLRRAALPG